MPMKRGATFAAVLAIGVCAGTIESRKGSASVTPAPLRRVRRDTYFLVMNIDFSLAILRELTTRQGRSLDPIHLKRLTLHDAQKQLREAISLDARTLYNTTRHW